MYNMSENTKKTETAIPVAPLKIAALESCIDFAREIDRQIVNIRKREV